MQTTKYLVRKYACAKTLLGVLGLFCLPALNAAPLHAADTNPADEVSARQTVAACEQAGHRDPAEALVGRMNYNSQRIFRKICATRGADDGLIRQAGEALAVQRFSFEQARSYEALADVPGFGAQHVMPAIEAISSLSFASGLTFRSFAAMRGATVDHALQIIPQLNASSPLVNKAARSFFAVPGMSVDTAARGLPTLSRMDKKQAQALITYAEVPGMGPELMMAGMELIERMDDVNVWNARSLFKNREVSGSEALAWLRNYFALPTSQQEAIYDRLQGRQKSVLLKGLYDGAEEAIWKINNLHAVTNDNGYEYSAGTLNSMSSQNLRYLFNRLDPVTRSRFAGAFGGGNVAVLRQATSAARSQAARDLPTAGMYVVLAQGSELYDSSFRDIIVPVMKERIARRNGGDLLGFLRSIDPESRFVSDFISSNAQKGKLTDFFPQDFARQKEILNLVASSAFKDPDSVLLFSATFAHLLKMLTPEARSHLIALMGRASQSGDPVTAKLVRVILQYYEQNYPELLGTAAQVRIVQLLAAPGSRVNLDRYQVTPFAEWKRDNRIASLSMYHPDDDGRQSFASNANLLMKAGYRIEPSRQYSIGGVCGTGGAPGALFSAMRNRRCAISFVRTVGGVQIVNTQFVYSDKETQKELLRRFILSGDEMLAQRGHSYWRSEQIIEPLQELIEEGQITPADLQNKQRFLSLGSCGGVKVYTTLTRLFESRVDLLASIGTGLAMINDPYNKSFCEIVARTAGSPSWKQVAQQTAAIFAGGRGQDYLQPGSLTAILHKILDEDGVSGSIGGQSMSQGQRGTSRALQYRQQEQILPRADGGPVYIPRNQRVQPQDVGRPVRYGN